MEPRNGRKRHLAQDFRSSIREELSFTDEEKQRIASLKVYENVSIGPSDIMFNHAFFVELELLDNYEI